MYDYHMHTNFSNDSDANMEQMVIGAIDKNLVGIAITDHMDYDYPPVSYGTVFTFDFNVYKAKILELKQKYNNKIDISVGVEMGLQPTEKCINKICKTLENDQIDFVIGSCHVVDYNDLYEGEFFKDKTQKQAYSRYFEYVYESALKYIGEISVFGHLDFVNRYGDYADKKLYYPQYSNEIDEILKLLIKNNIGIEVNTSGFRYGLNTPHPTFDVIKRYRQLGGEIITTGSDAHKPDDIAHNFRHVYDALKQIGFKYICIFKNREPKFIKI